MKKKSIFLATLCLAMATTGVTAFASSTDTLKERVVPGSNLIPNPFVEDQLISPMVVDINNPIGEVVKPPSNDQKATVQKTFKVNTGYGHLKLLLKNYSNHTVTVSLTHNNSGRLYFSEDIVGKSSYTWRNTEHGFEQGMIAGEYTLQWSGGGNPVNGEYFGKTGSSASDIKN